MDDVRRRLRETAEAHQPDRDAMLVRIQQGMVRSTDADRARSYSRRRRASLLKVSLAGLAGVGVLSLGGLAVAAGVQHLTPEEHPPAVTPIGESASATPRPSPSATRPAVQIPSGSGTSTPPRHSAAPTADGPIAAHGTVDPHSFIYWEQNNLTVDVAQPLTALTVELRIRQSGGVQNTGSWQTAPTDDFTITVMPSDGFLVYRWVLKPGQTVPVARHLFGAQFNHIAGKRDASNDTFLVETTTAGRAAVVRGGFTP